MFKSDSGPCGNATGEQRARAYLKDAQYRLRQACDDGDAQAGNALALVEDALDCHKQSVGPDRDFN